jgi:TonB family protein
MTVPRTRHRLAMASVVWLAAAAGVVGQDSLARAKDLYVLAAYDEALTVLNRLYETASPTESTEIAGYQVFCLLALGRMDAAQQAIAALLKTDPLYRPSEATASPRTRAIFEQVRQGLLPGIIRETYDKAKSAYDRNDPQVAVTEFDRVIALLDEPGVAGLQNMADLRRLASGFRDLSKTAAAAAAVAANAKAPDPPVTAPPPAAASPVPAPPTFAAGDADVVPPATVSRNTPTWLPRNDLERRREYRGVLEILVDERGDVVSTSLAKSVHPLYDAKLIEMSRTWKFRPATKDGVPVRYRTLIEIRLGPGGS